MLCTARGGKPFASPLELHDRIFAEVHAYAADESLHCVADVAVRWDGGYRAMALKPAGKGLTTKSRPTARRSFSFWRHYTMDEELVASGLLGPVRLRAVNLPREP